MPARTNQPIMHMGQSIPNPNEPTCQRRTLFFTEGDRAALLVVRAGDTFRKRVIQKIQTPQTALDWCMGNQAGLVFTRMEPDPKRN